MIFNMTQTNYSRGTNLIKKAFSFIEKNVLCMRQEKYKILIPLAHEKNCTTLKENVKSKNIRNLLIFLK